MCSVEKGRATMSEDFARMEELMIEKIVEWMDSDDESVYDEGYYKGFLLSSFIYNGYKYSFRFCSEEEQDIRRDALEGYIRENLWSFRPEFINRHLVLDVANIFNRQGNFVNIIQCLQEHLDWNCNDFLVRLTSIDDAVEDVINSDEYGHFFNEYDGSEYYVSAGGANYYVYLIDRKAINPVEHHHPDDEEDEDEEDEVDEDDNDTR
jgi:hypothetical protein